MHLVANMVSLLQSKYIIVILAGKVFNHNKLKISLIK